MTEQVKKNRVLKEKQADELSKEIKKYPVIALFKLDNLPARFLQKSKAKLKNDVKFKVAKNTVLVRALKKAGLNDEFIQTSNGPFGILMSKLGPFKLFKELKKAKGETYAKAGQIAPSDIKIPAGETAFPAGPALSEFKQAGLDVKIIGGKIHITKDKVVAKEGEPISDMAAKTLQKLDIRPFEVGVELDAAHRDGIIYLRDVLNVDEEEYLRNLLGAFQNARTISVEIAYPTKQNIDLLIVRAHTNARNLAVSENIPEKEVLDLILAKAHSQAGALSKLTKN
jgi:large subunit ribosomal protein L10